MRLEHLYPHSGRREKRTTGIGFTRTFLLAGILMVFLPFVSSAIFVPAFTNSSPQYRTICSNLPVDIGAWLSVNDIDPSETLTWDIVDESGANGVLSGFPATASTPGSTITPSGLTFTPDPGATTSAFTISVDDGTGSALMTIILTINAGPALTLGTMPAVCAGVTSATIPFSGLSNVGPDTVTFSYTGSMQSWTVPSNVTSVKFDVMGAAGGTGNYAGATAPGKGGRIEGILSVAPGSSMNIFVGGQGENGSMLGAAGGYNGGGDAFFYYFGCGGAGGGASDIRIGGTSLADRKVVAGGGGGDGSDDNITALAGGAGGGLTGGASDAHVAGGHSNGGTQTNGGAPATYTGWSPGAYGVSGVGGNGSSQGYSGGGGGGYYGGGGGIWTGGGGGSSFADGTVTYSVSHTQGAREGDGMVTLYYSDPGTYTIIWDATADGEGFLNVASAALPTGNEFNIDVPSGAAPGTYHGTLTINNISCNSIEYPIEVTVKPLPDVTTPADQVLCHGEMTTDVFLSGSVSGGSYSWVNDNPAIGLDPSGTGHIPAFAPVNGTPFPVTANITVTPVADGCIGASEVFHIIDNPVPMLNSTTTPASICNNMLFSYIPTSLTPGTTFEWSRASVAGIANAPNTGTGNPNETLFNLTTEPITVTYVYTLSANTCTNTVNVMVVVNPTPSLTSPVSPAPLCNSEVFSYTPTTATTGASLTWHRPVAAGISNPDATGTGAISETLINTTVSPKTVTYVITLGIDGCEYDEDVTVTVNPPLMLSNASEFLTSVCDSQLLTYIPTTNVPGATATWSRGPVTGISNPATTGASGISESLANTTPDQIDVTYIYTIAAFGCTNTQNLTITVNPKPQLSSSLTPPDICTNTLFGYTPSSLTSGATFVWARDSVRGIVNPVAVGSGSVSEIVINNTDTTINVPYLYTITGYGGCADSQVVMLKVHPLPRISNDISNIAVCDSALLDFNPASITPGATFSWTRDYVAGISNLLATGTENPNERLNNTTYITVPVTYVYTITANTCTNTQNVTVKVRPSPVLTSNTAVTCSGAPFTFDPVSYTPLSQFAWSRAATAGITPDTAAGEGSIQDTLTHSSSDAMTVVYDYALSIYGCVNMQQVTVTVNPAPPVPTISTKPDSALCNGATFISFGAETPAADGFTYSWGATGATLHATGGSTQYALVSFNTPGTAVVTLTSHNATTTCTSKTSFDVTVGGGLAQTPEIIYFDGQFICKQNEQTNYQWGYDDAATLEPTALDGETNQNYFNQYPEWSNKYYWVITSRNGCSQKTYYNRPTGVADVNRADVSMNVFPNPASSVINVEVSSFVTGEIYMNVYNMVGQQLQHVQAQNNKAQISIADLPAGAYIVDCYSDGIKVAAARFIKN